MLRQESVEDDFISFMIRNGAFANDAEYDEFKSCMKPANCSNLSSPPNPHGYVNRFSAESISIINELYAQDFDTFGYTQVDPTHHDTQKLKGYFGGQSSGKL